MAPVTVAIATLNRSSILIDALRSCRDQTLQPERVIVIDDGSVDATSQVVSEFDSLDIAYVNVGPIGLGHARNLATALCRSRYLCILDDDDIMLPNRIQDHMASFAGGAQLSHGGWINFNAAFELEYRPGKPVDEDVIVYVGAAITHGACCYETAVLREFPYRTDIVGGADYDLAVRVIRSGVRCSHTGSYVLLRRRHEASMSARNRSGQTNMRDALVNVINLTRTDADIARRTASGSGRAELLTADGPPLAQIYQTLGGLRGAMRMVGRAPRSANGFFAVLDALSLEWSTIEVIDQETTLTATIGLACRPTRRVAVLAAFEAALRKHAIKPVILAADARKTDGAPPEMRYDTSARAFRIALRSLNLRELYFAFKVIRSQRPWEWYLVVRREIVEAKTRSVYYLVTAPFKKAETPAEQQAYSAQIQSFVHQQTDLFTIVIDGACSP